MESQSTVSLKFNMKLVEYIIFLLPFAILAKGATFLEPNCGISKSSTEGDEESSRENRGDVADMFGNPWMVYISSSKVCGGSLITNRFVLTAAHCLTYEDMIVSLGDFDTASQFVCSSRGCNHAALKVPVDQQIAHPQYMPESYNDVALLRLVRSVEYTDYIRPVCLLTSTYPLDEIRHFTVTGWGVNEPSNILKTHTTHQQPHSLCIYMHNVVMDIFNICAQSRNSSSCSADSGSPVTTALKLEGTSRIVQFGIVSNGNRKCSSVEVYSDVMHHMEWIREVVRQGGSQTPHYPQHPQHSRYRQHIQFDQHPKYSENPEMVWNPKYPYMQYPYPHYEYYTEG